VFYPPVKEPVRDPVSETTFSPVQPPISVPAGANFFVTYEIDEDAVFALGSKVGTLVGGATVADGKLNLKGSGKHCEYLADLNADSAQVGCLRIKVIPNYSGTPADNQFYYGIVKSNVGNVLDNLVNLYHTSSGGFIHLVIYDSSGVLIISANTGTLWNPTAGVTYEIELNWDITAGAHRVFIDGTQIGNTLAGTGTRDEDNAALIIGRTQNAASTKIPNYEVEEFAVFPTVQHVTDYTPT